MNTHLDVAQATECLARLEIPLTPQQLCQELSMPMESCIHALQKFEQAGYVHQDASGLYYRDCTLEEITVLDILTALWSAQKTAPFQMLYQSNQGPGALVVKKSIGTESTGDNVNANSN